MIKQFSERLKKALENGLPGFEAQKKMLPRHKQSENFNYELNKCKRSAVLILFFEKHQQLHLLFIKRAINGSKHSGQIAFPGGKVEKHDKDFFATALRETHEETGINTKDLTVIGTISSLYIPVSNYNVQPVIAYSTVPQYYHPNEEEVASILEIPVKHLLNINNTVMRDIKIGENIFEVPCYQVEETIIWGATAMILSELLQIIRKIEQEISL